MAWLKGNLGVEIVCRRVIPNRARRRGCGGRDGCNGRGPYRWRCLGARRGAIEAAAERAERLRPRAIAGGGEGGGRQRHIELVAHLQDDRFLRLRRRAAVAAVL